MPCCSNGLLLYADRRKQFFGKNIPIIVIPKTRVFVHKPSPRTKGGLHETMVPVDKRQSARDAPQ